MSQIEAAGTLRERFPLRTIKIVKKTIGTLIPLFFIAAIVFLALAFYAVWMLAIGFGVLIVLALIVYIYQWYYFRNYFYDLTENGLVIRKGVISSWSIVLPQHKVQDVYLDQDLLDRIFGLYDLHFSTATDVSQREAHIDGLSGADANKLRELLVSWISQVAGKPAPSAIREEALETMKPDKTGFYILLFTNSFALILISLFLGMFGIALCAVVFPIVAAFTYLDFNVIRYELRREGVFIRTGYILPKESTFLYRNIQDLEERQGIIDRLFSLRTLTVKTMTTTSVMNANLAFLSEKDATSIRQKILELKTKSQAEPAAKPAVAIAPERIAAPSVVVMPAGPGIERPFVNNFMKAANFSNLYTFAWCLAIGLLFLLAGIFAPFLLIIALIIIIPVPVFFCAIAYLRAIISNAAYSYAIYPDRTMIKYDFIILNKREIPFEKVQDIEKHVSFPNSFAKLASIKFETGAKELVSQGKSARISSASLAVETVPDINDMDAESLKKMIAERMGISLDGLGIDPLEKRFPLEKIKPIKKTVGLAIILLGLFFIAIPITLAISQPLLLGLLAIIELVILSAKFIYEYEYYKKYYYDMNGDVLVIKKGVFGSRELTVPLTKIQDVFINRDFLDLIFGLYDVYISTATSRSIMNAHIDGVNEKNAEALALMLVNRIAEKK